MARFANERASSAKGTGELGAAGGFDSCFRAHYADVLAFALRRVAGREAAEDVAAETFAIAWRRRDVVPNDPLPWLLGAARRVIANQARSGRRRARLVARLKSEPADPGRDPADTLGAGAAIRAALRSLNDRDREVLTLVAWEGLEPNRAAAVLGCSPGAFAVRLHRARRRLAKELAASGHFLDENPDPIAATPEESAT